MILSLDEYQALAPELVIVAGIILAIIVPNLGDARVRLPLTSVRIPILWGGRRFELTSDPRAPGVLSAIALTVACLLSGLAIDSADGMSISGVIQVTGFSRFMSMIFAAALAMTAIASIYRIPSTRLSSEDLIDPDDSIESSLMDNRRQVDLHLLLLMVALGMSLMALASDLFFLIVCIGWIPQGDRSRRRSRCQVFHRGIHRFCHWNIRNVAALHLVRQPGLRYLSRKLVFHGGT